MSKTPNPIDIHVGARLRLRRLVLGMSQEKLGEELGLTFQQVQKYEKGVNRIGAGRLFEISRVLDVPVGYFYDELEDRGGQEAETDFGERPTPMLAHDILNSSEGLNLVRHFLQIENLHIRRRILELVRALSSAGDLPGADQTEREPAESTHLP